jgi:hypothetical protein
LIAMKTTRRFPTALILVAAVVLLTAERAPGGESKPIRHPANGSSLSLKDVDFSRPVYRTEFDNPAERNDWVLEGGKAMTITAGRLVLESTPLADPTERNTNHLVCWLKKEMPADFLFEVALRPQNKRKGLNIVFFSYRGINGESIFSPALAPRDGNFKLYHSGDLNGYHVSYWAPPRPTTHIRKNRGFALVADSDIDVIATSPPETFETLRIHKRGAEIRVAVGDKIIVAWDDDGKTNGPAHLDSGWIGLRQMGDTLRCEYERLAVYPLKTDAR